MSRADSDCISLLIELKCAFPGSINNKYQTAYVLFGLAATRDAGYEVDTGVIERGATWLAGELNGSSASSESMDPRTAAYSLYALTMVGDQDILESSQMLAEGVLAGDVDLDAFSRAALAIALLESGDADRAQSLVDSVASEAKETDDGAYWPTGLEDGVYRQKSMGSTAHSPALGQALVAWRVRSVLVLAA